MGAATSGGGPRTMAALPAGVARALARILPEGAMGVLSQAAQNGDRKTVHKVLDPPLEASPEGSWRRRLLLLAVSVLLGRLAATATGPVMYTRPAVETLYGKQERLFPTSHIGQAAPFDPTTAAPTDWATYVAELGPSAASATTVGVPEAPGDLLRRLEEFKATGRGRVDDLRAAVRFWNSYWAEKYAPLLRWVRRDAPALDHGSEADAAAQGRLELFRARKRVQQRTDRAIRKHFAFFDRLKRAVQGTPLQELLSAYSDRATEWELAKLETGIPARTAYLDPAFPPVNDPSEFLPSGGPYGAEVEAFNPFLAAPHATLAARHAKAGVVGDVIGTVAAGAGSVASTVDRDAHLRVGILPCGPAAEYCTGAGDMTDATAAAIRAVWDSKFYTALTFAGEATGALAAYHSARGSPVAIVADDALQYVNGRFSALFSTPVDLVAKHLRRAPRGTTKVVFDMGVFGTDYGHAEVMVVDLVKHDVVVFDPHGQLMLDTVDTTGRQTRRFEDALREVMDDPAVVAASGGAPLRVHNLSGRALDIVSRFGQLHRWGPQGWQTRGVTSHEDSCQLWSLWFTHVVARYPAMGLGRALETGVRGILENADVDDHLLAKVFSRRGLQRLTKAEKVRVGDAMTRFIHRFATQLMSLMPHHTLNRLAQHAAIVMQGGETSGFWQDMPPLSEASTFATGDTGAPQDARQRVRDILATLAPPAGAAVTEPNLHRLWRLRQGLRSPRYVDAAATEAFGPFHAGREEQVLRFLDATRFLDKMHAQGADLGPTLSSSPGGLTGMLHRAWDAVAGRSPSSTSGDSYRGEVATGTFQ